jgi:hypothetical protein
MIISRTFLLGMWNVSDKSCTENQNTHFMFSNIFRTYRRLWDNVEKYCRAGKTTDDNITRGMSYVVADCPAFSMLRATGVASSLAALWTSWPLSMSSSPVCGPPKFQMSGWWTTKKTSKMQRTYVRELQRFEPNRCNKGHFKYFEPLSRLQAKFKCMRHSVSWKAAQLVKKKYPSHLWNLHVQHHVHNTKCTCM